MPSRTRPIEKLAAAAAKCSSEAAVYGKCVAADYQNPHKDMCLKEFMALKQCYTVRLMGHERERDGGSLTSTQKAAGRKS